MTGGLLIILDDITIYLKKVAAVTKLAANKASMVAGDDLAVNSTQLQGAPSDQELTLIKKIAIGGFKNKAILTVVALLFSATIPWIIVPLLMAGGAFLCFEGVEKVLHAMEKKEEIVAELSKEIPNLEEKVKGAIRTDFILSAEIIIISLGAMSSEDMTTQIISLLLIGIGMNILIYGLVAGIVKIDDLGFWCAQSRNFLIRSIGLGLVKMAPIIMKTLSILGTIAMFLVGGGILAHNHYGEAMSKYLSQYVPSFVSSNAVSLGVGFIAGLILVGLVYLFKKVKSAV